MELSDGSSNKTMGSEEEEGEGSVDHVETPAQLVEAPEYQELTSRISSVENSVEIEEIVILEVENEDEGEKDLEAEKSSVNKRKRQDDDLSLSPVKRRQRNLEIRRKAIDKFEEEMINFVL